MQIPELDFSISKLGEWCIPSPMTNGHNIFDRDHVLYHNHLEKIEEHLRAGQSPPSFEKAGPREKIYFDPSKLKCGIVTCGGLCPGLNDVIRAIVMSLHHYYGVPVSYTHLTLPMIYSV